MPVATSPARAHRLVRGGTYLLEVAVALWVVALLAAGGVSAGPAVAAGLAGLVLWGTAGTVVAGGSPLRLLSGHRVVALDGGRAPLAGAPRRELLRLVSVVAVLVSFGLVGIDRTQRADLRWSRWTATGLVGTPRRGGLTVLAAMAAVLAGAGGWAAVAAEGYVLPIVLGLAALAAVEAGVALLVDQADVVHLARAGLLGDIGEPVPDDGYVEVDPLPELYHHPLSHPPLVVEAEPWEGDDDALPRLREGDHPG